MGRSGDYGAPHDYQPQRNGGPRHGQPAVPPQFQAQDQGWQAAQWQPYAPQFTQQAQYEPSQYPPSQCQPRRSRHTARNVIAGIGGGVLGISVAANSGHTVQTVGSRQGRRSR